MTYTSKLYLAGLAVFILGNFGLLNFTRNVFNPILSPLRLGIYDMSNNLRQEALFIINVNKLSSRIKELELENFQLRGLKVEVKELEKENKILKEQLNVANLLPNYSFVEAEITGFVFGSSGTRVYVNVGQSAGLEKGAPVIINNYLVGLVDFVEKNYSEVLLLGDSGVRISVISQESGAKGTLFGSYGTNLAMKNVLINESVQVNDIIVTSSENKNVPKGLIVGEVISINFEEEDILKEVILKPLIDVRKVEKVFIIIKFNP